MTRARNLANLGNSTTNLETLDTIYSSNTLTGRNLIINGAMNVAQRGTSFSLAHDGTREQYVTDRFEFVLRSTSDEYDATVTQTADAPDNFVNSFKVTTGTAESAIGADEFYLVRYHVEAQDVSFLNYGSSSAKTVTLSFYVKSSVTGTYGVSLYTEDSGRNINKTYTINSANTWERKTIVVAGDTSGSGITHDNGIGIQINWILATGSDADGTTNTDWGTYSLASLGGGHAQDGVITTASATWQITGVQLEVGETATPFEHKSYADDEWGCQRYYHMVKEGSGTYMQFCTGRAWGTGGANAPYKFPRVMRASPTMTAGGAASDYDFSISAVPAAGSVTLNNDMMMINISGSFTTGQIVIIGSNAGGSGPAALMFDAEL